jgi:apolipoprotein D and lipocalin family protein
MNSLSLGSKFQQNRASSIFHKMKNLTDTLRQFFIELLSLRPKRPLPTVAVADKQRYSGKWYEIARLPNSFEKGLECVTATYSVLPGGSIGVLNRGVKNGKARSIKGRASAPDPDRPGRLKVTFFWPFSGDYWIIALDGDYQYALVGDPSRKYLWVLSRSKTLAEPTYNYLLSLAAENSFPVKKMLKVPHGCDGE